MELNPGEWLCIVEMVAKYGEAFTVESVRQAAEYLIAQGEGYIVR